MNRIQKLLFSEKSDFEDMVLIESPFAEVTREGLGLRQLQIGLTPSRLILTSDVVLPASEYPVMYFPGRLDAEIENLELILIFPIEVVALSVFKRRRRKVLKARFHDGDPKHDSKVYYFELGGGQRKQMFWNLWCEKVRGLTSEHDGSSTETSVASSTSLGSLCLARSRLTGDKLWHYYGVSSKVPDPIGSCLYDVESDALRAIYRSERIVNYSEQSVGGHCSRLNCFSEDLNGNNSISLTTKSHCSIETNDSVIFNLDNRKSGPSECYKIRPSRTYAFLACPNLLHSMGVFTTDNHGVFNMQLKRSRSLISIIEERKYFSGISGHVKNCRLLRRSESLNSLGLKEHSMYRQPDDDILSFWTTDQWYRPYYGKKKIAKGKKNAAKKRKMNFLWPKCRRSKLDVNCERPPIEMRCLPQLTPKLSLWDLNSTALAHQLTIIDTRLFIKIPPTELRMAAAKGHARNCANLMAWLIFSHRVSCLVATEILLTPTVKSRARLIARVINSCEKCNQLSNQQSTLSILSGLQSPAVYRLQATWAFVRQHHSTRYACFKRLCHSYRNLLLPDPLNIPSLPSAALISDLLLARLNNEYQPIDDSQSSGTRPNIVEKLKLESPSIINHQVRSIFLLPPSVSISGCSSIGSISSISNWSNVSETENFFQTFQQAARKYDLVSNSDALHFLLKQPYEEHQANFYISMKIEPNN